MIEKHHFIERKWCMLSFIDFLSAFCFIPVWLSGSHILSFGTSTNHKPLSTIFQTLNGLGEVLCLHGPLNNCQVQDHLYKTTCTLCNHSTDKYRAVGWLCPCWGLKEDYIELWELSECDLWYLIRERNVNRSKHRATFSIKSEEMYEGRKHYNWL